MKRAANPSTRTRSRKKSAAPESGPSASPLPAALLGNPAKPRNIDPVESTLSLWLGVLVLAAALFPRSIKQWLLLSFAGSLVYRGMTGHSYLYEITGIDTTKEPLWQQVNEKFTALE